MVDLRHALDITAGPDRIRPFVDSAEGFMRWWAEDAISSDPHLVELGFFNRSTVYRLRREPADDAVLWRCESGDEWAGTLLVFRSLPQDQSRTRLEFTHGNWKTESPYFTQCNTVWGHLMFRLKAVVEGAPSAPFFTHAGTVAGY
jgi:hypothetical protein